MLVDNEGSAFEFGIWKGLVLPAKGVSRDDLSVLAKVESYDGAGSLGIESGASIPSRDRRADSGKEEVVVEGGGGSR